jgi:hypothetical protein
VEMRRITVPGGAGSIKLCVALLTLFNSGICSTGLRNPHPHLHPHTHPHLVIHAKMAGPKYYELTLHNLDAALRDAIRDARPEELERWYKRTVRELSLTFGCYLIRR